MSLDENLLYIDSLEMFRALYNKQNNMSGDSTKLQDPVGSKDNIESKPINCEPIEFKDNFDELLLQAVANLEKHVPEKVFEWQKKNETTPVKNTIRVEDSGRTRKLKVAKLQLSNHR